MLEAMIDAAEELKVWQRFSVGYCKKCGEVHHLVDALCWDCRAKKEKEAIK